MQSAPPESWNPLGDHIGRRILVFASLPSTNDFALQHIDELSSGTVVLAREQSAGRGNYGRSWLSPAGGGVWMTVIIKPPPDWLRPVVAIAWVGVSIAEVICQAINRQPDLKWPNDVLLRGRKVAGILIEQRPCAMIVGIGVNVNQSATQLLADGLPNATSMSSAAGHEFSIDAIAQRLVQKLDHEYSALAAGEMAALESCWKWRMGLLGRSVTVERTDGTFTLGRLNDMTFAGLSVETSFGVEHFGPEHVKHVIESAGHAT